MTVREASGALIVLGGIPKAGLCTRKGTAVSGGFSGAQDSALTSLEVGRLRLGKPSLCIVKSAFPDRCCRRPTFCDGFPILVGWGDESSFELFEPLSGSKKFWTPLADRKRCDVERLGNRQNLSVIEPRIAGEL